MFAFLTPSRKRRDRAPRLRQLRPPARRASLGLEELERRDCPAAPQITALTVTEITDRIVQVQGTVVDESPQTVMITLSGEVSGTVQPNSSGFFAQQLMAAHLGTVNAWAVDNEGLTGQASAQLTSAAPTVTLQLKSWGANKQVTLKGKVTDESPSGRVVYITGAATGNTLTDSSGNFEVTLTATSLSQVRATTLDPWGQSAPAATLTLTNTAPTLSNLQVTEAPGGSFTFSGRVTDEYAPGLVVSFSGLPSLEGQTATVQADGTFSLTVTLGANESGTVLITVQDWWGIDSLAGELTVFQALLRR